MTKRPTGARFTPGEIAILRMLWEQGEATLSEAHAAIVAEGQQVGYTTVQTRLERLVQKGAVAKSDERPTKYSAVVSPDQVTEPLLNLLVERVSGPVPLVAHLLQDASLTPADLQEIRRLIADAERSIHDRAKRGD
ncbi:MAG: BlaI/MecI/CopY family transcriptional regulator [Pirellulaceae bacterium]|nr:BlaI/MecI/CopY family transcriptional regulator [Pirellulaceae bacterium]